MEQGVGVVVVVLRSPSARFGWANRFVQAGRVDSPHRPRVAVGRVDDPGPLGLGQVGPHGQCPPAVLFDLVRAQHLEWILVVAVNYRADGLQWNLRLHGAYLLRAG